MDSWSVNDEFSEWVMPSIQRINRVYWLGYSVWVSTEIGLLAMVFCWNRWL